MARLSARDKRRAADIIARISACDEARVDALGTAVPLIRELIGAPFLGAYSMQACDGGVCLQWDRSAGLKHSDDEARRTLAPFFSRMSEGRGPWNPFRPPARQRNRAVHFPWKDWGIKDGPDALARNLRDKADRVGFGRDGSDDAANTLWKLTSGVAELGASIDYNLRVLICDDDRLINLVGLGQDEPFTETQRLLLQRAALPLRDRLIVERRVGGSSSLGHAAMVAALDHIPAAAFVLDAKGRVAHANAVGRHRLEVQGSAIRLALLQAVQGEASRRSELVVTKLTGAGMPPLYLVIINTREDRVRYGTERARDRWQLTAREVDVLAELAAGHSNREIAEKLSAATRTVEIHVSSILRKAHADSRSQLIIDLWHLADAA